MKMWILEKLNYFRAVNDSFWATRCKYSHFGECVGTTQGGKWKWIKTVWFLGNKAEFKITGQQNPIEFQYFAGCYY